MTVIQPNSVAGINSITVQNGNSLSIHKSDGSLLRTITGATGVTTFATASVGAAWTDFSQGGGLNIGLGASISNGSGNVLTFGTNGDDRVRIDSSGDVLIGRTSTSTSHTLCVQADNVAEAIAVIGRSADDISEIGFFENDTTTRLGELQYRRDHINFRHRVGDIRFCTAGTTERLRIDSSGKVLIGRTSSGYGGCVIAAQAPSGQAASLLLHRGSNASNADVLGILHFNDQNDYTGCQIRATANENWSGSAHGSYLGFYTTDNTTTTNDERLRITSDGRLLVGHTASEAMYYTGRIQVQGTSSSTSAITVKTNQNDSGGPAIVLGKSRGAIGSATVVQNNDELGAIYFNGADGTDTISRGASIRCHVDGTPGSNDMPGRLQFYTTPDGAAAAVERMRLDSLGNVLIGNLATASASRTGVLVVETNNYNGIQIVRNSADASTPLLSLSKSRGTSSGAVTAVNQNDICGRIRFQGADGDELSDAAYIDCMIDAAPGNNDMAGRLKFYTSADGSSSPTSRLEINKDGYVYIKTGDLDVEAGSISDSKGNVRRVIENEPGGAAYQMVAADAGKFIHHNNTIKMPNAGQLSIGDMVTIYAYGALTLDCTKPDGAEALIYNAADATTGDRTFAARALGTLLCVASNTYVLSGAGIS